MAPKNRRKPISTAYALKSDDGVKNHRKSQYPAYALKSDDGQKPKGPIILKHRLRNDVRKTENN